MQRLGVNLSAIFPQAAAYCLTQKTDWFYRMLAQGFVFREEFGAPPANRAKISDFPARPD